MDEHCISDELLTEAMHAKSRALAASEYAFVVDDVVLNIDGDHEEFTIARDEDGEEVLVNAKHKD